MQAGSSETNQWEREGRCVLCRREKYCTKPCRKRKQLEEAYKNRQTNQINSKVFEAIAKVRVNKVNDQVFEALSKSTKANNVDESLFDKLGNMAILN